VTILLSTKFFLPPIPAGFVARPQLVEKLDEAISHCLTLVSAPAGAGKTTLVSSWARSASQKGVVIGWLSLDEADNDPERFLQYLVACLEEWGVVIDSPLLSSSDDERDQAENTLENLLRGLINLKHKIILILDDYHLIQNPQVHAILEYLLEHISPPLHLVLLTRSDPPFELARLRVSGELVELRMEHLRFSVEEASVFLKKSVGTPLLAGDILTLNERTEGWVAGLQMAAISLRGREDAAAFVAAFAGSHRYVFDYLVEEVLDHQSAEVRNFLLKTSILERLSAPLCDVVAETKEKARSLLVLLERTNLFLIPLDEERGWYRYHHLFADLLKQVLAQTYPGLAHELHRRACRWHETQGMLTEALHHALSAGDMELVARMVSSNVLALVEQAELIPILRHIDAIPRQQHLISPWLGVAHAWGLAYAGQLGRAEAELAQAESQSTALAEEERGRMMGYIGAVRAYTAWSNGDQSEAVTLAEQAISLLPPDEIAVRAFNLTTLGNALVQYTVHPQASAVLEQAMLLARQAGQSHVFMLAAGAMAYACIQLGQFHRAYDVCKEAIEIADSYQRNNERQLTAAASIYAFLSRIWMEWGEPEKALQAARKGLVLSELWGQADTIMVCLLYLAQTLAFAGEAESTQQVLQRARKVAQMISPWHILNVDLDEVDTWLDHEQMSTAEILREVSRKQEAGFKLSETTEVRLLLKQNHTDEALALLQNTPPNANSHPSYQDARQLALYALAYFQKKEFSHALITLDQAFELAEAENRLATFAREGEMMEKLVQLAQAKTKYPAFVRHLLAVFEARHKTKPNLVVETLIEPLSARELEILGYLNSYLSAVEIANQLVVSTNTVRTHMKNIYGKLGVHGRSEAVGKAKKLGLLA
jgi:LuxR family maltose regulon positive regulatory protein